MCVVSTHLYITHVTNIAHNVTNVHLSPTYHMFHGLHFENNVLTVSYFWTLSDQTGNVRN